MILEDIEEAVRVAKRRPRAGEPCSIALIGNAAQTHEQLRCLGLAPDVVTDQTSAHDTLNGYVPVGYSLSDALRVRAAEPELYMAHVNESIVRQVQAMLEFANDGAITFEYGNNLRGAAKDAGLARAFDMGGFVPMFVRDEFCRGRGPFRWVCLSGEASDLALTDQLALDLFPHDERLRTWMHIARERVPIQHLPARTCWLALGERERFGLALNALVRENRLKGPVAMSRDHLDSGFVAQPTRETEAMLDGSDAVADWPLLNAMSNVANGADLVSIHQGAGSGMGGAISAGMIVIADGSESADERISRTLFADPASGVIRHADAGYESAHASAQAHGLSRPWEN